MGALQITPETKAAHRARWFARLEGEWIPRNSIMPGSAWGWDVRCSCGWETRTGGAIEAFIRSELFWHRFYAQADAEWLDSAK